MSKQHTTIKYIRNNYRHIYRAGYCDLYHIFRYEDPVYYNSGVYGWNCDIYVDFARDIAITTGYRNMAGTCIPSEIVKKYSDIAKSIVENYAIPYDEMKAALAENRENFLNELLAI